jgi:hypothetical protein
VPGYLDGSHPNTHDLQRITAHILGETLLTGEALLLADVNGDGDVDILDLHIMRRAVYNGLTLPFPALIINAINVSFIRPGGRLDVEVFELIDANGLTAQLVTNGTIITANIVNVESINTVDSQNQSQNVLNVVTLEIPNSLAQSDDSELFLELRLYTENQHSNAFSIRLIDAPRIDSITRSGLQFDERLTLNGEGFSIFPLTVRFGTTDVDVTPINDNTIKVDIPNAASTSIDGTIFVIANGRRSNPEFFSRLTIVDVNVELPSGSSLILDEMSIYAPDGTKVPIAADGSARVESEYRRAGTFEVIDLNGQIILQAHNFGSNILSINTLSTACSLVYEAVQKPSDNVQTIQLQITQIIGNLSEVFDLQSAISSAHNLHPRLEDQFENVDPVRTAMKNAVITARNLRQRLGA